jgi:hypothetical protein
MSERIEFEENSVIEKYLFDEPAREAAVIVPSGLCLKQQRSESV